jgi:MFS family permease
MSSVYSLGALEVAQQFGTSTTVSLLGISLFCLGLAFGPMLGAPLSETHGRRIVYMGSFPISILFILGAGLSNNMAALAVCRFFAGFFGSPTLSVGGGTNADLYVPAERGLSSIAFLLAPFAGPAFGAYSLQALPERS